MKSLALRILAALLLIPGLLACEQEQTIKDPIHQRAVDYFKALHEKRFDDAYNFWDAETREAWPKEEFVKLVSDIPAKVSKFYIVKTINRDAAANSATITCELTGQYNNWNKVPGAKCPPKMVQNAADKQWYYRDDEKVAVLQQKKERDKVRLARLDKYKGSIVIDKVEVRSIMVEEEPKLAFTGTVQNTGTEPIEVIALHFRFFGRNNEVLLGGKPLQVHPVFPNPDKKRNKSPLLPGKPVQFEETILSEISGKWQGEFKWELYDAGPTSEVFAR